MRLIQTFSFRAMLVVFGFLSIATSNLAWAKDPPSDLCSLVTPEQLQKILGDAFNEPKRGTWPAPFAGQPSGTQCVYMPKRVAAHAVTFIAYADASAAQAKENFEKLSAFYPAKSKPSVGDSAYIDTHHAIHVLKGRVRYFIDASSSHEQQATDLAKVVAAEL